MDDLISSRIVSYFVHVLTVLVVDCGPTVVAPISYDNSFSFFDENTSSALIMCDNEDLFFNLNTNLVRNFKFITSCLEFAIEMVVL